MTADQIKNAAVFRIELTQGLCALVDAEDMVWLNQWKWFAVRCRRTFYAERNIHIDGKQRHIMMHRAIALRSGIISECDKVDHINGNGLDNTRSNLRASTVGQNNFNARKQLNRTSAFKGVSWKSANKKWVAQIGFNGCNNHLGLFEDELEAARAYDSKAKQLFGAFAWLNFPQ